MKIALFPGSFDPITNGHLEILKRAVFLFDKIVILVAINKDKVSHFTPEEKVEMAREAVASFENVSVEWWEGYTVDYAAKIGAKYLIRGIRDSKDFDYEMELFSHNKYINKDIDTIFFIADGDCKNVSSSLINEMKEKGEDISTLVPDSVLKKFK